MAKYIEAEQLKETLRKSIEWAEKTFEFSDFREGITAYATDFLNSVDLFPSANVVRKIESEWRTDSRGAITCQHCAKRARYDIKGNVVKSNFCPACGAVMRNAE